MTDYESFKKVVCIGPSLSRRGGMEKLARLYKTCFENIIYLPTNSPRGTFVGFFVLLLTCARLPFYRLKGRKILHIHVASGKSFFRKSFVAFWGRCLGYKIIMHSHAGDFPEFVGKIGLPIAKRVLSMADRVIALSPYWKNYFEETLDYRNIAVVPNFTMSLKGKNDIKGDKNQRIISFLYLGILTKEKGVDILLKAYKDVADRFVNRTRLVIAGAGPLCCQLKKYSDDEIKNGSVEFTGWVDYERCDVLLHEADVLVLPSKYECQPMALIEAMTAECGIVATRVGGIPDIVIDGVTGLLVDYGDVGALSGAMMRYVESPELIDCHVVNAKSQRNIYTPENVASILNEIYEEIS